MIINLETYEAVHLSEGYGLILVLHGENQLVVPENDGIVLSGGSETHVKMKLTKINRQGYPYSDCANTLENGKTYSYQECLQECFASMYRQFCYCVLSTVGYKFDDEDSFYGYCRNSPQGKTCHITLKCATDMKNEILQDTDRYCGCPASCSEKIYTTSISSRRWPNDRTRAILESEACEEKDYCPLLDPDFNITKHQIETNFLKVMLYFEDLNHQLVEETPIYDATRLLSDVGGSVGLCLGVSILCIVELIEVVLELFEAGVKKIFRR
ncbi:SCNN1B [Mytilus coruscus]|uniref:SCNN1B n=1 Tax=Mytilus coruscus TaxID=42192 RepID=A0A6J8E4E0_MYTCO|nr:SCNN1B [Mytilus coruscus]